MVSRFLVCFVFAVAIASVDCNSEGMEIIYTFVSDFLQIVLTLQFPKWEIFMKQYQENHVV